MAKMARSLTVWLPLLALGIALAALLSMWLEAEQAGRAATRYLGIWESEIARSILMNENRAEAEKLLSQIEEFHPSLKVLKNPLGECPLPVHRSVSLFSLPATEVVVCRDPGVLARRGLLSPIFWGLLLGLSGLVLLALRREYRSQLLQLAAEAKAESEAKLGRLSRQVAHDIRGPLSALQILATKSQSLGAEESDLLLMASQRIQQIAENLLRQSRSQRQPLPKELGQAGTCRPDQVLREMTFEFQTRFPEHRLLFSIESDAMVGFPALSLQRMISNLLQNAADASQPGQEIVLATRNEGERVTITIADQGVGISDADLQKIGVEEFTKGKPDGNGLGLFEARQSLDHADGKLTVLSREGVGTQVTISLPALNLAADYSSMTNPSSSSKVF